MSLVSSAPQASPGARRDGSSSSRRPSWGPSGRSSGPQRASLPGIILAAFGAGPGIVQIGSNKVWNVGLIRRTGAIGSTLRPTSTNCCVNGWPPATAEAIEGSPDRHRRTILTARWRFPVPPCRPSAAQYLSRCTRAFATDTEARSVAEVHSGIWLQPVRMPNDDHRVLCYLPFEHSEDIEDQRLALQLLSQGTADEPRHRICPASFGDHRQVQKHPT